VTGDTYCTSNPHRHSPLEQQPFLLLLHPKFQKNMSSIKRSQRSRSSTVNSTTALHWCALLNDIRSLEVDQTILHKPPPIVDCSCCSAAVAASQSVDAAAVAAAAALRPEIGSLLTALDQMPQRSAVTWHERSSIRTTPAAPPAVTPAAARWQRAMAQVVAVRRLAAAGAPASVTPDIAALAKVTDEQITPVPSPSPSPSPSPAFTDLHQAGLRWCDYEPSEDAIVKMVAALSNDCDAKCSQHHHHHHHQQQQQQQLTPPQQVQRRRRQQQQQQQQSEQPFAWNAPFSKQPPPPSPPQRPIAKAKRRPFNPAAAAASKARQAAAANAKLAAAEGAAATAVAGLKAAQDALAALTADPYSDLSAAANAAAAVAAAAANANAASALRIAATESTLPPPEQEQQLPECPICFCEIESAAETWTCGNANHAQHTACTTCLQYHIHSRVEEGMLIMSCPVDYATCAYQLTQEEVQKVALPEDAAVLAAAAAALKPKKRGWFSRKSKKDQKQKLTKAEKKEAKKQKPPAESIKSQLRTWWRKKWKTRQCRKCNARIEKNGGCNHMTCRCGHEICWQCGGDYVQKDGTRGHGGAGGGTLDAAFPAWSDRGNACHTTKLWAIRVTGVIVGVGVVLPLVIGIGVGIVLPVLCIRALAHYTSEWWKQRGQQSRLEERAARWQAQLENEVREATGQPCGHYYSPSGDGTCYFCPHRP